MNAPHIILDNLPSLCQKLSHLVEIWRSYNKNNFSCFFLDTVYVYKYALCRDHQLLSGSHCSRKQWINTKGN